MEKIYEEKNNVKEKKRIKMDGTVILSFAVALIAIASLITVGFKQISYAALTDVEMPVGDSFLVNKLGGVPNIVSYTGVEGESFYVHPYYVVIDGENKFSVYCLERNIEFTSEGWYTKDDYVVEDGGLLYLLANLHSNGKIYKEDGTEIDSNSAIWVTQTAVWVYMAEKNLGANSDLIQTGDIDKIRKAKKLILNNAAKDVLMELNTPIYDSVYVKPNGGNPITINQLIEKAKNDIKGPGVDFSVNGGNDIKIKSVSTDGKYYVSEIINVQGTPADTSIGEFKNFSLTIDSAPEGTVITDQDGKPLTKEQMNNIAAGTKLYVRVPTDKVKEENKVAQFTARGYFDTFVGYGYRAKGKGVNGTTPLGDEESQMITLVDKVSNTHKKEFKINLDYVPDVPDTGMNTAQSIYFIGLVVLLCGIGIVYANAKPATNKQ